MFAPITFVRQTFATFHTTGAVAPSSRFLSKAMVRMIPHAQALTENFKVLEVGAGTGPFTQSIATRLKDRGSLDVYEINPAFVEHLKGRIANEAGFKTMGSRLQVYLGDILEHAPAQPYDLIVSGLPFNNFPAELVERFLTHFKTLLKPNGKLTFFEYIAVRRLQQPFVGKAKRQRLQAIAGIINDYAKNYQVSADLVFLNLPPARARHMVFK